MPSHLHTEVRRRAFPSSYDHDTINPHLLWKSLGIDIVGGYHDAGRWVGGDLRVVAGGPSDCRGGHVTDLAESGQRSAGEQYVSPAELSPIYTAHGTTRPAPVIDPPDYEDAGLGPVGKTASGIVVLLGAILVERKR